MELKIIQKTEKPLLLRTEISAEFYFEGKTPSKEEVKGLVVKELKSDNALTLIKKIRPYFGARKAGIIAYVYSNKEAMEKIEPKKKKKQEKESKKEEPEKEEAKEKPKEAEKKPGPSKEESKKEEKKEEPKKEVAKKENKENQ